MGNYPWTPSVEADKNIRVLQRHLFNYKREKNREEYQEKKIQENKIKRDMILRELALREAAKREEALRKESQEKESQKKESQKKESQKKVSQRESYEHDKSIEGGRKSMNNNMNSNMTPEEKAKIEKAKLEKAKIENEKKEALKKAIAREKARVKALEKEREKEREKARKLAEKKSKPLKVEWFSSECKLNIYTIGLSFYQGAFLFINRTSDPEIIQILGYADYEPDMTKFDLIRRAEMPEAQIVNFDDVLIIKPSITKPSNTYDDYDSYDDDYTDEMDFSEAKAITLNRAFRNSIKVWLGRTDFNSFSKEISQRVKGQEQLDRVLINVYSYMENMAEGRPHNNNILIAAPSGCGKTETFRALRDYFAKALPVMPIYQVDMTSITEEGFKGKDTKAVVSELQTDKGTDGIGIVFLDEFDKRLLPSHDSKGNNINKAIQSQLLTTFEGVRYPDMKIDTNNTLFIALGAFDACRENKSVEIKHIGFGAENEGGEDHYADINRKDIIDIGASYELLGRFGTIVNYHKLSDKVVDGIINGMAKEIGQSIGAYVKIHDDFRKELRENANSKFGCRLLKSMINDSAMEAYLEIQKSGKFNQMRHKRMTIELQGENKYRLG